MTDSRLVMERVVTAFNTGDLSVVDGLFAAGYIDHQKPAWVTVDGPEEFRQVVRGARQSLPNLQVRIEDLIAAPTAVAARLSWRSVDDGGTVVERETIELLHLQDGRIVEHWGAVASTRSSDAVGHGDADH